MSVANAGLLYAMVRASRISINYSDSKITVSKLIDTGMNPVVLHKMVNQRKRGENEKLCFFHSVIFFSFSPLFL